MSRKNAIENVNNILGNPHKPVTAETLDTPVEKDAAGNPIGSTAERAHSRVQALLDRSRIIRALNKQARLSAEDLRLARELGIEIGPQQYDPTNFDL